MMRKDHYNSVDPDSYAAWFEPFAREMHRALADDGSFVLNIKENVIDGERHPYVMDTVKKIRDVGFKWNETYIWQKSNSYPMKPVKRFKDSWEYLYHFTKSKDFKFRPDAVKVPVNPETCARLGRMTADVEQTYHGEYTRDKKKMAGGCASGKVYPTNVIVAGVGGNRGGNHPARFSRKLPEFFIKAMTDPGDVVLDPFSGSGTTVAEAKKSCRKGIGFDIEKKYVDAANADLEKVEPVSC
jgi:DNA modification methylase